MHCIQTSSVIMIIKTQQLNEQGRRGKRKKRVIEWLLYIESFLVIILLTRTKKQLQTDDWERVAAKKVQAVTPSLKIVF